MASHSSLGIFNIDYPVLLLRGASFFAVFWFGSELPRTVLASSLHVVILGQRRHEDGVFAELSRMAQDDFRAAVVVLDRSVDFNRPPFELAYVPDVFEIVWQRPQP